MKTALSTVHSLHCFSNFSFPPPLFNSMVFLLVIFFSAPVDIVYGHSITETVTYIFSRYGISGNVDGLKCSSIFLKDVSSPLALQTSKA